MTDNNGYVLAPLPVAPVNETDMVLLPEGLKALKKVAKEVGLDLRGAYVNLDGGFDSRANRKCIFNAGLIPNIKENPRNRKRPKRGRKRLFNAAIHALRMRVKRSLGWEDRLKRLLLGFDVTKRGHYVMKRLEYTLINLRNFGGPKTSQETPPPGGHGRQGTPGVRRPPASPYEAVQWTLYS